MKKEDLFESMGSIDPELLERSEKATTRRPWKGIAAMAACFCLILVAAVAVPNLLPQETPVTTDQAESSGQSEATQQSEEVQATWTVIYNDAEKRAVGLLPRIDGYFTEELSSEEIAAISPSKRTDWMAMSGNAGFDGNGKLIGVYLTVTTLLPNSSVSVTISEQQISDCIAMSTNPQYSRCGNVEYHVIENRFNEMGELMAYTKIDGKYVDFYMQTAIENIQEAKRNFEVVLECFAEYPEGIDLEAVTPEEIPEWFDRKLTWEEAGKEEPFGAFWLRELPIGFQEESIYRYKDQNSDYLSGLWTRGLDELRWKICCFRETDESRLVKVSEKEKYDLSLYPIPRAESVPEELREVVDNPIFDAQELSPETVWARAYKTGESGDTEGWHLAFTVRYGDILIEITAKGIDPQWVYEQMKSFCKD